MSTIDYNATVYFIPDPDPADTDLDDVIERLMDALAPYHPSVGQEAWHDDIWYAIITFPAEDLRQAIATALAIVSALGRVHGIDALPTALFDARYHINAETVRPPLPEQLLGTPAPRRVPVAAAPVNPTLGGGTSRPPGWGYSPAPDRAPVRAAEAASQARRVPGFRESRMSGRPAIAGS